MNNKNGEVIIMKTYSAKKSEVVRKWLVVDIGDKTLGRVATEIALLLMGKKKPMFTPHIDSGDFVIVLNAEKVKLTGNKEKDKEYFRYTGYQSGTKFTTVEEARVKYPERIITAAVKGMLPKNKHRDRRMKRLKVIIGSDHGHSAQMPEAYTV